MGAVEGSGGVGMNNLVQIPVPGAGAPLMAAQISGKPMVSLRAASESVGVDYSGQLQKLKGKKWALEGMEMISTPSAGGHQQVVMIDRKTFTMWLATIDASRVTDRARPTIEAYQMEAADALDAYFNMGVATSRPMNQLDAIRAMLDQIEAAQHEAEQAKHIAARTDARLDAIEGKHEWFSALAYAKMNGRDTSSTALNVIGRKASAIAKTAGLEPNKVQHQLFGLVNAFPSWVWDAAYEPTVAKGTVVEVERPADDPLPVEMTEELPEWLTVAGAAEELGVTTKTVRRWITAGTLRAHRLGPRLLRIAREDLEALSAVTA